jgi:competence protein ComEC
MPLTLSRFQIFLVLFVVVLLGLREFNLQPDGKLHVHFLDVAQGDSTLIVSPSGKQILIDGGPDLSPLAHLGIHMPFFDRTIELLVLTHPDSDHVTALTEIMKRYDVERVLLTGVDHELGRYEGFLDVLIYRAGKHTRANVGVEILFPDPKKDIDMGDGLVFDVMWPNESLLNELSSNNSSIVVRAIAGDIKILLTGDIESEAEEEILKSGADIRSDILKVPHHGSRTSSTEGFLQAVEPRLAIVSTALKNRYGHPHEDVLNRYETLGIPIRSTATEGTISLTFP